MQTSGHWRVNTARKLLFIQICPQFSQKLSASIACMLATFSMSEYRLAKMSFKDLCLGLEKAASGASGTCRHSVKNPAILRSFLVKNPKLLSQFTTKIKDHSRNGGGHKWGLRILVWSLRIGDRGLKGLCTTNFYQLKICPFPHWSRGHRGKIWQLAI